MSIQTEINRIGAAKQNLMRWLSEHKIALNINATIDELVALLDMVSTESSAETSLVPVKISGSALNTTIVSTVVPKSAKESALASTTSRSYLCPANSLVVLYCTCTGGTATTTAYPGVAVSGDVQAETVYVTYSNASTTKPMAIYAIHVGAAGGTVTLARKTSSGVVM